jgi:hypothetical protein
MHAAISSEQGIMLIPTPDYLVPSSFGSLELSRGRNGIHRPADRLFGGQHGRDPEDVDRRTQSARVDFIKLDIEGMELERWKARARRSSAAIQFFWLNPSGRPRAST